MSTTLRPYQSEAIINIARSFDELQHTARIIDMPTETFDQIVAEVQQKALTTTWGTPDQQIAAIKSRMSDWNARK